MKQIDGKFLESWISLGEPTVTLAKGEDLNSALAKLFKTTKSQIRRWYKQKAIYSSNRGAFMIVRIGKTLERVGVVIFVKRMGKHETAD